MNMAGQSINDRLTAARYSLAGQGLAKSVCKATTEEVIGPKKKHLDYLLHCTNEPNVSIPQLANLLIERSQMQSWVIVFKALITVHHLMCYGNERFTQYLASSNCNFNLGGFLDKTGSTDQPQLCYDMSTFIRRYAKYINEKAVSYRSVAFDFCKTKRGKDDGTLRAMPTEQLLKSLPILQAQLDALLDFDCAPSELNNGVINSAFMLLFRDLIRLFACYNDGIINLLEKYFEMNKKQARDALDCYKKFLIRMDRVSEFLKVAESVGMDKSEIPDLKQAPSSLLEALEAHLASLEGKKVSTGTPATGAASFASIKSVVSTLNSTSASFGFASSNGRLEATGNSTAAPNGSMDEITKRAALAEEEAMYEKLKSEHSKNNPFLSSPSAEASGNPAASNVGSAPAPEDSQQILDLFGAPTAEEDNKEQAGKTSDDLLQLAGNPFANILGGANVGGAAMPSAPQATPQVNGFNSAPSNDFVSSNAFAAVFGNTQNPNTFDGLGDILKPQGGGEGGGTEGVDAKAPMGGTSAGSGAAATAGQPAKLISNDLDMSLSSLVDNLNIKGPSQKAQWSSPKAQSKTGGVGWAPNAPMVATTGGFRPPGPPISGAPGWTGAPGQQPMPAAFAPGTAAASAPGGAPTMPGGAQPVPSGAPPAQGGSSGPLPPAFDPFGAL